ncbi:MAG: MarC family protein [Pirellulales bacterium]
MTAFWLCFVPLFVAMDPLGLLPIYLGLTEGLTRAERQRILFESLATAMAVSLAFLFMGQAVFSLLGIGVADFMVAGGVLLFGLSLADLLLPEKQPSAAVSENIGAVPLGVPLLVGPGVLTTLILLADQHGSVPTLLATLANILVAGAVFWWSAAIHRLLGKTGTRVLSKIASLILAAIGVMMVRKGVERFLK